jgi:hypothetical protein
VAETVCCPTCWTWSELQKSTTCKRCGTPLIFANGNRVDAVGDVPAITMAAGPPAATLLVAAQPAPPSLRAAPPDPARNLLAGIAGGIAVAIAGAALWAGIADATHYRLGVIGLAIGVGIAWVFARFGLRGPTFAIVAATLAVAGCVLGDIGAGTLIVASRDAIGAGTVLTTIPIGKLMNVDGLDAFFYALAAFAAFRRVVGARRPLLVSALR